MAIGKDSMEKLLKISRPKWRTSITKVEPNRIITRGYPQENLIGNLSFTEMVYLILKGELPSNNHSSMLEAVLVSFCDHGITPPSTQVARIMASAGSNMNACVSGGIMAFGKYHAGALERCMRILQETVQNKGKDGSQSLIQKMVPELVDKMLQNGCKIPGFGHRYHQEDPRASSLLKLAHKYDCNGIHTEIALKIQEILIKKKDIRMNIDGANACILSDMGFDWNLGTGIFMIGRLPGIIAHVNEEKTNEIPFRKIIELDEIFEESTPRQVIDNTFELE